MFEGLEFRPQDIFYCNVSCFVGLKETMREIRKRNLVFRGSPEFFISFKNFKELVTDSLWQEFAANTLKGDSTFLNHRDENTWPIGSLGFGNIFVSEEIPADQIYAIYQNTNLENKAIKLVLTGR